MRTTESAEKVRPPANRARSHDKSTMNLELARVNAARREKLTTVPALTLRTGREEQPPANRARPTQTPHHRITQGRACRRGGLAMGLVTRNTMSKHSEEV